MQEDNNSTTPSTTDQPLNYTDDARVMRFLLHNVKGISPVSGGEFGENLVPEYVPVDPNDEDTVS